MIKIVINGILGKMGTTVLREAKNDSGLQIAGGVDTRESRLEDSVPVVVDPAKILSSADVVIDFSSDDGVRAITKACQQFSKPLVTGTTALEESTIAAIHELSQTVPVVQAFNFSIGINLLTGLLKTAASVLKNSIDAEIIDIHHRQKKDSPSGTAILLAVALARNLGLTPDKVIQFGRSGKNLSREKEIAVHSLRGGSVIGEHQVHLLGKNENLVFTHQALSREVFADGALRAVHWVHRQGPGYYSMNHVLGI